MIGKLKSNVKERDISNLLKNDLLNKFSNPVNETSNTNLNWCEHDSTRNHIRKSVECAITNTVNHVIDSNSSLLQSKSLKEMTKSVETVLRNSNFGTFEYEQKTGRNFFRVTHSEGSNGTEFLEIFFKKVFDICLKNYSFHTISNESYVCVMFR